MPFVLDASIAASWAFPDEDSKIADEALMHLCNDEAIVPSLWWFEIRNTLLMGERRRRITEADTAAFLDDLRQLTITFDRTPDEGRTLTLARQHKLTIYDAAYLELAERLTIKLATLDSALRAAASSVKVNLMIENS